MGNILSIVVELTDTIQDMDDPPYDPCDDRDTVKEYEEAVESLVEAAAEALSYDELSSNVSRRLDRAIEQVKRLQ